MPQADPPVLRVMAALSKPTRMVGYSDSSKIPPTRSSDAVLAQDVDRDHSNQNAPQSTDLKTSWCHPRSRSLCRR